MTLAHHMSAAAAAPPIELLPVRIRAARGEADFAAVATLRARTYGRHVPSMAAALQQPDALDRFAGTSVLMAHAKDDGRLVGTMRMQHNTHGPLAIEASTPLPPALRGLHLVEAARLCIEQGAPAVVRQALFKALFLHCARQQADAIVAVARRPLDRIYERLLFRNALGAGVEVPMKHIGNLPHQLLYLSVAALTQDELACAHPMHGFVMRTHHPDIRLPGTARPLGGAGERLRVA